MSLPFCYIYGPVPSRRLGLSLGIDILGKKKCSFDCFYCQVGKTKRKTLRRFKNINEKILKIQLKKAVEENPQIDCISISGSGEPTLHKGLDRIIKIIKKTTHHRYPVCVITNASLLYRKKIREELLFADIVIPSLDAARETTFKRINKPHHKLTLKKVIEGLVKFRQQYKGNLWLEIMLIKNINDTEEEGFLFKKIIDKINPDKVQINLSTRAGKDKLIPSLSRIKKFKKILGKKAEIVGSFTKKKYSKNSSAHKQQIQEEIVNFLKCRPASLIELKNGLNYPFKKIKAAVAELCHKGILKEKLGCYFLVSEIVPRKRIRLLKRKG